MKSKLSKTFIAVLCLAMSNVAVLGSCTTGSSSADSGETATSTNKEVSMVVETSEADLYKKWANEFETKYKTEGYTVKFTTVANGQVIDKQDNLIAAGYSPSIIVGGDVHVANQYRYLYQMDDLINRDNSEVMVEDYISKILSLCKFNDKQYYLPNFFNSSLLYYNKGIFDKYNSDPGVTENLAYPTNEWAYSDFLSTAKKLTVGTTGNYSQWGSFSTIGWWGEWLIHIRQNGGEIMNDKGLISLDTPEALAGLNEYLGKMRGPDKCSYITGENSLGGFSGKLTAMAYGGHMSDWDDLNSVDGLDWDVAILPENTAGRTGELAVDGLGIYKYTNALEASWSWIKYLTHKRTGQELIDYPFVSCRESEKTELLAIPHNQRKCPQNLEAVYDSLNYNKALPQEKYFKYVLVQIVQNEITKAVENKLTAEEALNKATKNANSYIKTNYQ